VFGLVVTLFVVRLFVCSFCSLSISLFLYSPHPTHPPTLPPSGVATAGNSGAMSIGTGTATVGTSGAVTIGSGVGGYGKGGTVAVTVGSGTR
jgi:hypothetical protein